MLIVRRVGAAVLVLAAVVVWFAMAPDEPGRDAEVDRQVDSALEDYRLNSSLDATTDNPQEIVNGWVARDLLEIVARSQAEPPAPTDDRVPAEIALAVVGLALLLLTSGQPAADPARGGSPRAPAGAPPSA